MTGPTPTVHACPPEGEAVTPCCGVTPFELPRTDRLTQEPAEVTCTSDMCHVVAVDGELVRVRGIGEMTAESRAALAEVIAAARRRHAAEHPEAATACGDLDPDSGAQCTRHPGHLGFHRQVLADGAGWVSWVGTAPATLPRSTP